LQRRCSADSRRRHRIAGRASLSAPLTAARGLLAPAVATTLALLLAAVALPLAGLALLPPGANAATSVWLCRPSLADDPCTTGLRTTRFSPSGGALRVDDVRASTRPAFDCFYVYPTVSDQPSIQATRRIDPEERSIALYQAARYSRDCRVYAPMYRQITLAGLADPPRVTKAMRDVAYRDVRGAWRDYLEHDNKGRGVVVIGHSQGTRVLKRLVAEEIDAKPRVRRRLISAILLGGNVLVRRGQDGGGDFKHVPACRSPRQFGCVVAFSTFDGPVPAHSRFGRSKKPGREVLCTNPASLGGGTASLRTIYPSAPFAPGTIGAVTRIATGALPGATTPWIEVPGAYRARCSSAGGANALQITPRGGAPSLKPTPTPRWGLHLVDANIALGDLADLVRRQAASYLKRVR
jgi:hypothetical protein